MLLHNRAHAATTLDDLNNSSGQSPTRKRSTFRNRFEAVLPKIVLSPTLIITLIFVYGFIAWTTVLSFTRSRAFANFHWAGLLQYGRVWEHPRWHVAIGNLGIYASLYVVLCMAIGLGLAILLDQRIRAEGGLRALFLYPMALSFIVTGTAWKWILNPGLGLTKLFHDWGWTSFQFDWIINDDMSALTTVPLLMGLGGADGLNILIWTLWNSPGNGPDGTAFWNASRTIAANVLGGSAVNPNALASGDSSARAKYARSAG